MSKPSRKKRKAANLKAIHGESSGAGPDSGGEAVSARSAPRKAARRGPARQPKRAQDAPRRRQDAISDRPSPLPGKKPKRSIKGQPFLILGGVIIAASLIAYSQFNAGGDEETAPAAASTIVNPIGGPPAPKPPRPPKAPAPAISRPPIEPPAEPSVAPSAEAP